MNKGEIRIACNSGDYLDLSDIVDFQGGLKKRSVLQVDRLMTSILRDGFSFPIYVWKDAAGTNHCLDGHGRVLALLALEKEGYVIPKLPVVYIDAESEKDARYKLIEINNVNGTFTKQGLRDFIAGLDIALGEFQLPDIDLSDVMPSAKDDIRQVTDTAGVEALIDSHTKDKHYDATCPKCGKVFSVCE